MPWILRNPFGFVQLKECYQRKKKNANFWLKGKEKYIEEVPVPDLELQALFVGTPDKSD